MIWSLWKRTRSLIAEDIIKSATWFPPGFFKENFQLKQKLLWYKWVPQFWWFVFYQLHVIKSDKSDCQDTQRCACKQEQKIEGGWKEIQFRQMSSVHFKIIDYKCRLWSNGFKCCKVWFGFASLFFPMGHFSQHFWSHIPDQPLSVVKSASGCVDQKLGSRDLKMSLGSKMGNSDLKFEPHISDLEVFQFHNSIFKLYF